ncbi:SIS domain-containing protein [uncultured Rubinisphaera sp.]|uniref:SIS domain-containing protein n=1 Tax=uncultured Rubinisphaera sp. TaxID=1678686 RepID=UPI0030D906A2
MLKNFLAMRLIHGGHDDSGVLEIVTTAINAGDLLVVISRSEETEQLIGFAKRVGAFVVTIVLLTVKQDSTIGNFTDDIFKLAFL